MGHTKTKYKKWDIVWVYWIFENSIKEETDKLKNQLDIYDEKTDKLNEQYDKTIVETKFPLEMKTSIYDEILKHIQKIEEYLNFGASVLDLTIHLERTIKNYFNKIFKEKEKQYRPCLIFHKSNDNFWVMPLSTSTQTNFNEKFDIKLDNRSHIECCSLQKVHISLIDSKSAIHKKTNLVDTNLQKQIIEKFTWFFLK